MTVDRAVTLLVFCIAVQLTAESAIAADLVTGLPLAVLGGIAALIFLTRIER